MVAKYTSGETEYTRELLIKGVDLCKFHAIREYHDRDRALKKLPYLNIVSFADQLQKNHASRPLDVAVSNEFDLLSGLEYLPNAKCSKTVERK